MGALIIIQTLGIDVLPLMTLLGIGGLTVALALQNTLNNFFAGLYMLASRQFNLGDFIELETGQQGYIVDMSWIHTVIMLPSNYRILIPNAEIAIPITVGVGYDSDLRKVENVTIEVAMETVKLVQGEYPGNIPYIRYHNFGPFSIDFKAILYAKNHHDSMRIKHEFIMQLHERFKLEGIDIPFPTSVIYAKKLPGKSNILK